MSILIDLIGATIILGIVLMAILGLNVNLDQASYSKTFTLITETNCVTLARMLEFDLVKAGYHTSKPAFLAAKSDSISFLADLRDAGTVNTVTYRLGPTSALGATKNPRDRMLYRTEDGSTIASNLGVTALTFTYYDLSGAVTAGLADVASINVQFTVESPFPVDTTYAAAVWQKRIYPRNLP